MQPLKALLSYTLLFACILLACSGTGHRMQQVVFAGSTPGDEQIKLLLAIHPDTKVDFIRWHLILNTSKPDHNTFSLAIVFGEAQPNTLEHKRGGEKRSYAGTYTITDNNNIRGEIYHLKSSTLPTEIALVKLSNNLLHLLTPQHRLMIGNGGWSYTLNRKDPTTNTALLPALTPSALLLHDTAKQVIYDGRTPCQPFATEHQMNVSPECFKLKWRLELNRDSVTHQPTTYTIRKVVNNAPRNVTGKWIIVKGVQNNPEVIIYKLDPDEPQKWISLLAGDDNVLFFLNRNHALYTGNADFSFTLNKKQ